MSTTVAGIAIPDSAMASAATAVVLASEPAILYRHSLRVFLFAALIGKRRGLSVDAELLYVAALFHKIGLTVPYHDSTKRFEVDGANVALKFLTGHRISSVDRADVWRAVALHNTFGIASEMSPLVALMAAGVETDLLGMHLDEVRRNECDAILRAYPRGPAFKEQIIQVLAQGLARRPATAFGTVNSDVLDRSDPTYRRLNFCGLILGSPWDE